MNDWLIARDETHTFGDGPNYEGDHELPMWAPYAWHNQAGEDWAEPLHPGGLTYDQAEQLGRAMGYTSDPVGR